MICLADVHGHRCAQAYFPRVEQKPDLIFLTRDNQEPTGQVILSGLRPSCPPLSDTPIRAHVLAVPCEGGRQPLIVLQLYCVSEFTSTQYTGCDASDDFPEHL